MAIPSLETRSGSCLNGSLNPQRCADANGPVQDPPERVGIGIKSILCFWGPFKPYTGRGKTQGKGNEFNFFVQNFLASQDVSESLSQSVDVSRLY